MARICFVELPVAQLEPSQRFFAEAFGWKLTAFGPTYSCTLTGDVDLGLQADANEATKAPLVVIQVENRAASLEAVQAAGGPITQEPFSFPWISYGGDGSTSSSRAAAKWLPSKPIRQKQSSRHDLLPGSGPGAASRK